MRQRPVTLEDLQQHPKAEMRTFVGPDCEDAEGLVEGMHILIPWEPDDIDVAMLQGGGTIWLTIVGKLPPHRIEVLP